MSTRLISTGTFQLVIHVVQNRHAGEYKGHTETRQTKGSLDFLKARFRYLLVRWSVGARPAISLSLALRSGLVASLNAHII